MSKAITFFVALFLSAGLGVGCAGGPGSPTSPTPDPGPAPAVVQPSPGAQLIAQFPCCGTYQPGGGAGGRPINPYSDGRIEVIITTDQPMAIQLRRDNTLVIMEKVSTTGKTLVSFQLDSMVNAVYFQNRGTGTATWQADVYLVR